MKAAEKMETAKNLRKITATMDFDSKSGSILKEKKRKLLRATQELKVLWVMMTLILTAYSIQT